MKTAKITRDALKKRNFKDRKIEVIDAKATIEAKIIANLLRKL